MGRLEFFGADKRLDVNSAKDDYGYKTT